MLRYCKDFLSLTGHALSKRLEGCDGYGRSENWPYPQKNVNTICPLKYPCILPCKINTKFHLSMCTAPQRETRFLKNVVNR